MVSRLLVVLAGAGCGGAPPVAAVVSEPELLPLPEAHALDTVRKTLAEEDVEAVPGWSIQIGAAQPLDVDLRLAGTPFGIEWASSADHDRYGAALPKPDPDGQLRILPGFGQDAIAQVLILDERSYLFAAGADDVASGAPGMHDALRRIERDVRDFIEYVRGQLR